MMVVRSPLIDDFFSGTQYNPLLATWPPTRIDESLHNAPSPACEVLKIAYDEEADGRTPSPQCWEAWLRLFRKEGASDPVQLSLAGLLFIQHELRHHIDMYSTTLGAALVIQLYGEYGLLRELCDESCERIKSRLLRFQAKRRHQVGLVENFRAEKWPSVDYEHDIPGGVVRVRRNSSDPTDGVMTLAAGYGREHVLSLNTLLESRAFIENATHLATLLGAAGASGEEQRQAVALLAEVGVDTTRDDYWAVLQFLSSADTARAMVDQLSQFAEKAYAAAWFALHPEALGAREPELEDYPLWRFVVALTLVERMRKSGGEPVQEWTEGVFERLQQEVKGTSLGLLLRDHLEAMSVLQRGYGVHPWRVTGLAHEHVRYLASVSAKALAARLASGPKWDDNFAWPTNSDPRSVVVGVAEPPNGVREAERTLGAVRNLLDHPSVDWAAVIATATPLFTHIP